MRLIVGAPVANRDWCLPRWFECLAGQSRRPDGMAFIHGGERGDRTWRVIERCAREHSFELDIQHDPAAPHPRHDDARFATLARLRNDLLAVVRDGMRADLFLSLDTDILLQDPRTIERLGALIQAGRCDLAQPVVFLHPMAPATWSPAELPGWAYNFAWLRDHPTLPTPTMDRPDPREIPWGARITIDIPMACWLGNRDAMGCEYAHHPSGEDVAFAVSLRERGVRCVADTGLYARHVWADVDLNREALVA